MPDDSVFDVQLVTPERILLSGPATEVILRTGEGDVSFLAGHAPLVGSVEPGVLRVARPGGEVVRVATHGGFVQVEFGVSLDGGGGEPPSGSAASRGEPAHGTRVTLLIGVAELAEEIDVERARAALERAQARVAELGGGAGRTSDDARADLELAEAESALRRADVRVDAAEETSGVTA